jgi:hypothetical protein
LAATGELDGILRRIRKEYGDLADLDYSYSPEDEVDSELDVALRHLGSSFWETGIAEYPARDGEAP